MGSKAPKSSERAAAAGAAAAEAAASQRVSTGAGGHTTYGKGWRGLTCDALLRHEQRGQAAEVEGAVDTRPHVGAVGAAAADGHPLVVRLGREGAREREGKGLAGR